MEKSVKRLLFLVMLMMCGMIANAQNQLENYVVQSGETLYSISRQHGVTVDDILKANPGMTENIMAGQTIKVPTVSNNPQIQKLNPCKTTHIVQKKETIYGIAQQYGLTEAELIAANPNVKPEKLKKNTELCIPYSAKEKDAHRQNQQQVLEVIETKRQESLIEYYDVIKIAVIAPFALNETRRSQDAQKMTDFYKGFLMAVDTLKHQGISCDIYAYEEIGSDGSSINSILQQPMLKHVNMIVGPFRPANAAKVAAFAAENNILMVTPMSTKSYDLTNYKNVFEISSPQSFVYQNVYSKFIGTFTTQNIVFVNMNDSKDNSEYINGLKSALTKNNMNFKTIDINDFKTYEEFLSTEKQNLLIPSSGSERALSNICAKIRSLGHELDDYRLGLFGYPEWQTYSQQKKNLEKYNAVFYTTFFANPSNTNITRFSNTFTKWFRREQVKSYPKYGVLGFDIGQYFIRGLKQKGSAFSVNTPIAYEGLQTPFRFIQRGENGAALNNSVMFVRVNSDGSYSVNR